MDRKRESGWESENARSTATIPAWWSAFLFHVLNPRQVCMYLYLTLLCSKTGECHPTIEQIREDLGLFSASMVFEALTVLEDLGFIVRERQSFPGVRAKRNVYRLTPFPLPILRLLERDRIDAALHPKGTWNAPAAVQSQALLDEGLHDLLGDAYDAYAAAGSLEVKREILLGVLRAAE